MHSNDFPKQRYPIQVALVIEQTYRKYVICLKGVNGDLDKRRKFHIFKDLSSSLIPGSHAG